MLSPSTRVKDWPPLYKRSNTGAILSWSIHVLWETEAGAAITTVHGQVDGAKQQTQKAITEGKNVGKANETSPLAQALAEAEAAHTKQRKRGYVASYDAACAGELDVLITGGFLPMLAPSEIYPHHAKGLGWPRFVQPKLDGMRCLAMVKYGRCELWSRTRKPITSVPHIARAIEAAFPTGEHITDGEIYHHDLKDDFEDLISAVRRKEPSEESARMQLWIYDFPSAQVTFLERYKALIDTIDLSKVFIRPGFGDPSSPLRLVSTQVAGDEASVVAINEANLAAGFEGSMVRWDEPYESGKRSKSLQKLKQWQECEALILAAVEGLGKDAGTVGSFLCRLPNGVEFNARLRATYKRRAELFKNPEQWTAKQLTILYQNLTAEGKPRFVRGKSIRDYD